MPVAFAVESNEATIREIAEIVARDGSQMPNTVAADFDPDYEKYILAAKNGFLRIYTVRDDGALVGYAAYIVGVSLHHSRRRWATSDTVWLDPNARRPGVAPRLLRYIEADLKNHATLMQTGAKVDSTWSRVLAAGGHSMTDVVHTKEL